MLISFFLPLYLSIVRLLVWEILPMISSLHGAWQVPGACENGWGLRSLGITKITSLDRRVEKKKKKQTGD